MNRVRYVICYSSSKIPLLKSRNKILVYQNPCLHTNFCFNILNEHCKHINLKKKTKNTNIVEFKQQYVLYNESALKNGINDTDKEENDLADNVLAGMKATQIEQKNTRSIFYRSKFTDKIKYKSKFNEGPGLNSFIQSGHLIQKSNENSNENIPYLQNVNGNNQKVYLEIYGCQMNVNDTEVVTAILIKNNYTITNNMEDANIVLLVTCAIRDSAETKIWNKLNYLKSLKTNKRISKIGLLGCMAERLKHKIIEEQKLVDIVAGPDSYRDLPRLLAISNEHEAAINVSLSLDETYADVTPVRLNPESKTAYVTIMRGCDNMCTYCIVPFTRGREKSRSVASILDEIQQLSDQGVKEITLLGQNVNSYRDLSESNYFNTSSKTNLAKGFSTVYKNKVGGLRFSDLLDKASLINPEMRIRFTSPHPKDFPDEVLYLISERPNICKHIHLPAQSGNSEVLKRMRRGYSREAYLDLVYHIRNIIPKIAISSDFIAGFCNETEEEFKDTLTLIEEVKYSTAFLYAYSMREKTTAYRRYTDNVDKNIKINRLQRMIKLYRMEVEKLYKSQIGEQQLILVEGESRRSPKDLQGRNDANVKVIFSNESIPESNVSSSYKAVKPGDYVLVHIYNSTSQILKGIPLYHSSIKDFNS